jgi:ubiquinone/menaquinone biosynthesis C-methylase UbiE
VTVHGLNAFELGANVIAHRRDVLNLNLHPALPYADGSFNFVTMAASVGYLTRPREVFAEMNRVLKPGGVAIVSFTNRVFDEKATSLWLNNSNCRWLYRADHQLQRSLHLWWNRNCWFSIH